MRFSEYLAEEWTPALGCTEPASIAYAAALAASQGDGPVEAVDLTCDPRIYKNCYAVGIPHSGHKVGIRWALAIGALLPDPSLELECSRSITPEILDRARRLIERTIEARDQLDANANIKLLVENLLLDLCTSLHGREAAATR